jgi:hypothetical protein
MHRVFDASKGQSTSNFCRHSGFGATQGRTLDHKEQLSKIVSI